MFIRISFVFCIALISCVSARAQTDSVNACIAGVRSDNPGRPDTDIAVGAGIRCCQQVQILRQDLEMAKSHLNQAAQCLIFYRNGDGVRGAACIDAIRAPIPGMTLPPASQDVATHMHREADVRRAQLQVMLDQSPSCRR